MTTSLDWILMAVAAVQLLSLALCSRHLLLPPILLLHRLLLLQQQVQLLLIQRFSLVWLSLRPPLLRLLHLSH